MGRLLTIATVLLLAGCSAQPRSASDTAPSTASSTPANPTPASAPASNSAVAASAPKVIEELTTQRTVYECPKCGMDFDAAGACSMDGATLVATQVDYSCPADGKPVDQGGQCPRCAMHARVEKTALATDGPSASGATPGGH